MPRTTREDWPVVVQDIMDGKLDEHLTLIQNAAKARIKNMWRKGMRVRINGTNNPDLHGKEGVILKVNVKTITVGVGNAKTEPWGTTFDGGEWNFSPGLLEKV